MSILENVENAIDLGALYNPNLLVTHKDITNGETTYKTIKVVDLEGKLERIKNIEDHLNRSQGTIRKIIDNLNMDSWYSDSVDKSEVLRDLCEIVDYTPQQEMSWTVTLTVSGTSMVNLDEVEDFDIRYHLNDSLSVDSNDFETNVDSWDIDCVDSQDWN